MGVDGNDPLDKYLGYTMMFKLIDRLEGGDGNKEILSSIATSLQSLDTKMTAVNDRVDKVEERLEKLEGWSSDHNNRLKKLESSK